jgi:hypothetical protein
MIFFSWSPPYFVKRREVLLSPVKMFQCSKLPCLGWSIEICLWGGDQQIFCKVFFAQNVCKSSSNMHVLVLRFYGFNFFTCVIHKDSIHPYVQSLRLPEDAVERNSGQARARRSVSRDRSVQRRTGFRVKKLIVTSKSYMVVSCHLCGGGRTTRWRKKPHWDLYIPMYSKGVKT